MFIRFNVLIVICLTCITLSGCQEDLLPSNDPLNNDSSIQVGTTIDDFSYTLSTNINGQLSQQLTTHDAVVLYFTMWCPVCDAHMSHIRSRFVTQYPNIHFIFVDYVSGTVSETGRARSATGYSDFDVIADVNNQLQTALNGTMATTIVIDKNFIVQLHEEFKDGARLNVLLNQL